ncbi:hypothetical protein [Hydrogenimonas urashimensis]|uniref:hypothetical protein n=1 Tax=Hydrogenimonas urashimensis TaxID=2740515 RepID=UPI0019155E96|nr:hypothetical protein [Hydrogenimonas urashimensis]
MFFKKLRILENRLFIMNSFLEKLFCIIAIDTEHLINSYLTQSELQYLNNSLKSIKDLNGEFYTTSEGENLEVLLYFLYCHKEDILTLWEDEFKKEILVRLYTSGVISGNYPCFHFDLSKFKQTYKSSGQTLTLYRVGREQEQKENLGNSWSTSTTGLKNYVQSSSIEVENNPVFVIEINDSEVLCEGNSRENELILKKGFKFNSIKSLDIEQKRQLFE